MELDNQRQAGTEIGARIANVEATLSLAKELLQDAVASLIHDTLAIRDACAQQKIALYDNDSEQREKLLELSGAIEDRSNDLIMHLQFQDMVNQLLDHMQSNLSDIKVDIGCRDEGLAQRAATLSGNGDQTTKNKPVTSSDMQAGDVELF